MEVDGHRADVLFRNGLAEAKVKYFDRTLETIVELSKRHDLYIVTNGVTETQKRRLNQTPLHKYIKKIFISEETGYQNLIRNFLIMFLMILVRMKDSTRL